MTQMTTDPFRGKEWRGVFRRRIGDCRLRILIQSGETFRQGLLP
jgi:hypothetical protein